MSLKAKENKDWSLKMLAAAHPGTAGALLPLVAQVEEIGDIDINVQHKHLDFTALMIVRKGQGIHRIAGTRYGISRGDVYVMGPGVSHRWSDFDHLVLDSFYFQTKLFDSEVQDALRETPGFLSLFTSDPATSDRTYRRWLHLTPDQHRLVEAEMAELRNEWSKGTRLGAQLARALLVRLLAHLAYFHAQAEAEPHEVPIEEPRPPQSAPVAERTRSSTRESTVAAAVRYLDSHFEDHITIEQVAGNVFLSAARLRQIFAEVMGRSPGDYLRHLRLERAKVLLSTTDLKVTEISKQSGIVDPVYFSRVFRAETGLSPTEYRHRYS